MEITTELFQQIADCQTQIGKAITHISKKKGLKQTDIMNKCMEAGYQISQATISNAKQGKGNLTLSNLLAISYALGVNVLDLLNPSFQCSPADSDFFASNLPDNSELFIRNPKSAFMKSYLGTFHILFYKTSGSNDSLIEGTLQLKENKDHTKCEAILKLTIDELDTTTGKAAEKEYHGELIISHAMRAVYCYLVNERIGELCMLVFQHIYTSYRSIETAMAMAVTTASGSNRRPTAHRMVISRHPIPEKVKDCVKGQLLMNTSEIFLSKEQLNVLLDSPELPASFKELLKKISFKSECYCIPEGSLYDVTLDETEQLKCISLVRSKSKTPKYNKISRKTDEALYALLSKKNTEQIVQH